MAEEEDKEEDEEKSEEEIKEEAQAAFEAALPAPGAPLMAARLSDMTVCPMVTGLVPHVGGPISMGSATVMVGKMPAARLGDTAQCATGPPAPIVKGSTTVMIEKRPAARMGDLTGHGGVIIIGCPIVFIGG